MPSVIRWRSSCQTAVSVRMCLRPWEGLTARRVSWGETTSLLGGSKQPGLFEFRAGASGRAGAWQAAPGFSNLSVNTDGRDKRCLQDGQASPPEVPMLFGDRRSQGEPAGGPARMLTRQREKACLAN